MLKVPHLPVGSGKTSLLMSLLGETNRLAGSSFLPSPVIRSSSTNPAVLTNSTALATQQPFLLSASIRENILFGAKMNEKRYKAVLDACALNPDLEQFELGDDTEVGERGTVLSGTSCSYLSSPDSAADARRNRRSAQVVKRLGSVSPGQSTALPDTCSWTMSSRLSTVTREFRIASPLSQPVAKFC